MSRKPKLPGAADFFAVRDEAGDADRAGAAGERSPGPRAASAHPDLLPSLTVPEGPTEKVTFYLHPLLLKRLELYKAQLLVEHNLKLNRSQIDCKGRKSLFACSVLTVQVRMMLENLLLDRIRKGAQSRHVMVPVPFDVCQSNAGCNRQILQQRYRAKVHQVFAGANHCLSLLLFISML